MGRKVLKGLALGSARASRHRTITSKDVCYYGLHLFSKLSRYAQDFQLVSVSTEAFMLLFSEV